MAAVEESNMELKGGKDDVESTLPAPILESEHQAQHKDAKRWLGNSQNSTVRGMESRHLTFIAIGGTIGTGIFLSAGERKTSSNELGGSDMGFQELPSQLPAPLELL